MSLATAIVTLLLATVLALSALIKLTRREPYVQGYIRVGVPEEKLDYLAILLLAGAAGLILGLLWAPIGVAAAIGVVCYFVVAVAAHIRADDASNLPTPAALVVISAAALVLRVATL
jgi:DoxX-like family